MAKGESDATRYLKHYIKEKEEIDLYLDDMQIREYTTFKTEEEVKEILGPLVESFLNRLTYKEVDELKNYSGYFFKFINNVMRGKWNYEENGKYTKEKEDDYRNQGDRITKVITKFPELGMDIKTYRGVTIRAFYDYGITSITDLSSIEGKYFYEGGFTSSSLLRNHSFFDRDLDYLERCNIEIEYSIPKECEDGAILLTRELSYSEQQMEFVFNSSSLFKITKVEVDKENNKAYIKAILIPLKLWDPICYSNRHHEEQQPKL